MNKYKIKWVYGAYHGILIVYADNEDQAIEKMWQKVTKQITLPLGERYSTVLYVKYSPVRNL